MTTLKITNGKVDITDPCYDRGTWCAIWDLPVKNGEYEITVERNEDNRIAYIMMDLGETATTFKKIGEAGVDAGLCGFFVDKPNFDSEGAPTWHSVCDMIFGPQKDKDIYEIPSGVCSSSGWGDGVYPIIAYYNKDNEIVAIEVRFIGDSGEDEDEDDYYEEDDEEEEE